MRGVEFSPTTVFSCLTDTSEDLSILYKGGSLYNKLTSRILSVIRSSLIEVPYNYFLFSVIPNDKSLGGSLPTRTLLSILPRILNYKDSAYTGGLGQHLPSIFINDFIVKLLPKIQDKIDGICLLYSKKYRYQILKDLGINPKDLNSIDPLLLEWIPDNIASIFGSHTSQFKELQCYPWDA